MRARAAGPPHGVGPDLRAGRQDIPPPTASAAPPGPPGGRALPFSDEPAPLWHRLATPAPDARQIAIHPGSGSPQKNWPLSRWVELCTWLTREHRADLLIVTGEADPTAAATLAPFGTAAHQLPLADLVARLARCRLFLGHDSGISHLAAACGVPSLLLFGPTDPAMWAPPAPHVTVLRSGHPLDSLSVASVQSALAARMN
ncbi:MAG: glycosyltransferase family 9 protein [Verrucomicrobia bacterium]|nr:glycosyltransferase family 9 protein [Verrucomicrobiota bacterium]